MQAKVLIKESLMAGVGGYNMERSIKEDLQRAAKNSNRNSKKSKPTHPHHLGLKGKREGGVTRSNRTYSCERGPVYSSCSYSTGLFDSSTLTFRSDHSLLLNVGEDVLSIVICLIASLASTH